MGHDRYQFFKPILTHRSLKFQAVFENYPLKRPIFEHLNYNRSSLWQRSLILISSIIAEWGMITVLRAFFGPKWGIQFILCPKI
jgi:hypothetical protein